MNESKVHKERKSAIHILRRFTTLKRECREQGMTFKEYEHGEKKAVNLENVKITEIQFCSLRRAITHQNSLTFSSRISNVLN